MLDSKNKIGNIEGCNIGAIQQTNIEKQENNTNITNNQVNLFVTGSDFTEVAFSHELFPDYIVSTKKMHNGKYALVSKPTNKDAIKKYPYNFKSSFKVIDERYKDIKDPKLLLDMIQYADSPVEVEITKLEQYLGDVVDPYPNPELFPTQKETKTYIMPQKRELPKVEFKINIEFDDSNFKLRNINLKLTKQLSSNKFILNNYEQKSSPVFIQLELVFISKTELKCNLNYKANIEKLKDSKSVYIFNEFVLNLLTKKYSMYDKEKQKVIMYGKSNNICDENKIKGLENYINLIKAIIEIERYFHIRFNIPKKIPKDDINTIRELNKKIKESKNKIKTIDVELLILKKYANIEQLKQLYQLKQSAIMETRQDVVFNILGKEIVIKKIIEKYALVKCSNVEEIETFIQNYETLNDDYELKVKMIPAKGKYFYKYTEILEDEKLDES